ncbi:hypothetical protein KUCAC02_007660, partial [Chaenocephalus aceratus]
LCESYKSETFEAIVNSQQRCRQCWCWGGRVEDGGGRGRELAAGRLPPFMPHGLRRELGPPPLSAPGGVVVLALVSRQQRREEEEEKTKGNPDWTGTAGARK